MNARVNEQLRFDGVKNEAKTIRTFSYKIVKILYGNGNMYVNQVDKNKPHILIMVMIIIIK